MAEKGRKETVHSGTPNWSLADLVASPDGPEMAAVFADLETEVRAVEAFRPQLDASLAPATFDELLAHVERVAYLSSVLDAYAYLWYSGRTKDSVALAFRGRVETALADARNRVLFFELWWKALDEEAAERLAAVAGRLRHYMASMRRFSPYTLQETAEKVVNTKDVNGIRGLVTVRTMIDSDLVFELSIDGETKTLLGSELGPYIRSPRPEVREEAYRARQAVYAEQTGVYGQIYRHVAADWYQENVRLRGFSSPIAVRNLINELPDSVVSALLDSCRENAVVYQRYFRLKAKWLDLSALRRVDIYAPLRDIERMYGFADGLELVLESMRAFSPEMAQRAERVVRERHLDAEPRRGKDGGAFSYGVVPDLTPWVSINYNDRADDVATLAHELGHAVHSQMARDQSVLAFHAPLPMAETASNFAELLLLDRMLERVDDPELRRTLLARFVDDSYVSILRQAYFVLFEREAHRLVNEEDATADELTAAYLENLREQFGDSVVDLERFRWEWIGIPHIYEVPFYCYAYSFGLLLVLALYRAYRAEGAAFVPRYLRILAYGGAKAPLEILDEAGFDIRSKAFWQGGFDVISGMIDELEALTPD